MTRMTRMIHVLLYSSIIILDNNIGHMSHSNPFLGLKIMVTKETYD